MTRIYCPTTQALLLLAVRCGEPAVWRVPHAAAVPPGRLFTPRPLTPIDEQLRDLALSIVGESAGASLVIEQAYTDRIPLHGELPADDPEAVATLYLATCEFGSSVVDAAWPSAFPDSSAWPSFPELLRAMPKDRTRLPYLRAFQVLSGGLQQAVKAVEASELAKHLLRDT